MWGPWLDIPGGTFHRKKERDRQTDTYNIEFLNFRALHASVPQSLGNPGANASWLMKSAELCVT